MTGFAERLIARGAGRPTGLPLLKPRPAARFEQEMSVPVEMEPSVEPAREVSLPAADEPRVAHPLSKGAAPAKLPPVSDRSSVPDVDIKIDDAPPPFAQPRPQYAAEPPHVETPSLRASVPQQVRAVPAPEPEPSGHQDRSDLQAEFRPRSLFFDEPLAQPALRPVLEAERTLPAPAISIGRIDVQFLPQERPVAPSSQPKPQRTRGFDSYARARRGEPR